MTGTFEKPGKRLTPGHPTFGIRHLVSGLRCRKAPDPVRVRCPTLSRTHTIGDKQHKYLPLLKINNPDEYLDYSDTHYKTHSTRTASP